MGEGVVSFAFSALKDLKAYAFALALLGLSFAGMVVPFLLASSPVALLVAPLLLGFVQYYVIARLALHALRRVGFSPPPFGLLGVFKLFAVYLLSGLIALFSGYNLKWLGLFILFLVLELGYGFVSAAQNPLGFMEVFSWVCILLMLYYLVVFYNMLRLSFSAMALLSRGLGLFDSTREFWRLTMGKFWRVFFNFLVLLVAVMLFLFLVSGVLAFLVGVAAGSMFSGSLDAAAASMGLPVQLLSVLPFVGAMLSFFIAFSLFLFLFSPLATVLFSFGFVRLYANLSGGAGDRLASFSQLEAAAAQPAGQSNNPGPKPAKGASSLRDLAEEEEDPSLEAKPRKKPAVEAREEESEPIDVEELDFAGLDDEADEEK